MTSTKPYFLRATYDWIVDNNCTPHLMVDATSRQCVVPQQFVKDGVIVLNVSPTAVRNFLIGSDLVSFNARFGGVAQDVAVPVTSVRAIYAKENGQGLAFEEANEQAVSRESEPSSQSNDQRDNDRKARKPPQLTIVK